VVAYGPGRNRQPVRTNRARENGFRRGRRRSDSSDEHAHDKCQSEEHADRLPKTEPYFALKLALRFST
jgi:hypothetical protein